MYTTSCQNATIQCFTFDRCDNYSHVTLHLSLMVHKSSSSLLTIQYYWVAFVLEYGQKTFTSIITHAHLRFVFSHKFMLSCHMMTLYQCYYASFILDFIFKLFNVYFRIFWYIFHLLILFSHFFLLMLHFVHHFWGTILDHGSVAFHCTLHSYYDVYYK